MAQAWMTRGPLSLSSPGGNGMPSASGSVRVCWLATRVRESGQGGPRERQEATSAHAATYWAAVRGSGMAAPRANRSGAKDEMSMLGFPSTMSSAMSRPATGPCMNPWPEKPAAT